MISKKVTGFSLLELMVVVAITAILGSIAFASYSSSVIKTKRTEAKTALMQLMLQEERFSTQNNTYIIFSKESTDVNEKRFKWYSSESPGRSSYQMNGTACKDQAIQDCVLLTAVPGTSNVDTHFLDLECGELSLTSSGIKAVSGTANKESCW